MNIMLFKYADPEKDVKDLQTIEIEGEPWFAAPDVCNMLDISNPTESLKGLDIDEKLTSVVLRAGQNRPVNFISESGLYALIFKSRKPGAKEFQRWVRKEVIPSIRKTGSYSLNTPPTKVPKFVSRYINNLPNVDKRYFSVITELFVRLYAALEMKGYVIPDKAEDGKMICPDISAGIHFAKYLKNINSPFIDTRKSYKHHYEDGRVVDSYMYPNSALPTFIDFIFDYWVPNHAEKYFKERDRKALNYLTQLLPSKAS